MATLALTALLACRDSTPPPVQGPARRVVSLAPNVTEILFALGAGGHVVGVTRFCDHPSEAADRPKIGGFVDPSFEAVLAQRPDLVIGIDDKGIRPFMKRLDRAGVRTLALEMQTIDQISEGIRAIAEVVGQRAAGERLARELDDSLTRIDRMVVDARRPRVLAVVGRRPLVVAGGGSFPGALIARAGGENLAAGSRIAWPTWSREEILRAQPDVIVDLTMGDEARGALAERWAGFESVPAVRDGRVVRIDDASLLRPGPRIARALELLAAALHSPAGAAP